MIRSPSKRAGTGFAMERTFTVSAASWPIASQLISESRAVATASADLGPTTTRRRSEEHTSELQSLMRISYAVFCLKKNTMMHDITNKTLKSHTSLPNHTNTARRDHHHKT